MQIKSNKRLNEELIKAGKVCIAGLIAVYISNELWYSRASTMTITVFLLLVSYPAASSSRGYFKQRFLANIYALCITAIIHLIFNGNLNLKIDSNRLDMSQHANILITSRLIEYLNKINEINEIED